MTNVAIVTGISKGYGAEVASVLLKAGWVVVGDARDSEALSKRQAALQANGRLITVPGDITDPGHRQQLVEAAIGAGDLRLLVNNASSLGPSPMPPLRDADPADLGKLFTINTLAPLSLIQACIQELLGHNGAVINISSDAAVENYEGWGLYSITKAALEKLSAILAVEVPVLRVYWLDPGDMQTDMHQAAFPGEDISDRPLPVVSAPAVLTLAAGGLKSGRYRASDLLAQG